MIRILITLILVLTGCSDNNPMSVDQKKVSEIYGVAVPYGVNAIYDSLENEYVFNIDSKKHDKVLDLKFTIDNQTNMSLTIFSTYSYTHGIGNSFDYKKQINYEKRQGLSPTLINLYIKNLNSTVENTYSVKFSDSDRWDYLFRYLYFHEYSNEAPSYYVLEFLLENLSEDSEVVVQFYEDSDNKINEELPQTEYQKLYSLLSFYQELSTTIPKKYNNVDIPLYINVLTDTTTRKTVITSRDITREYSSSDKDKFTYLEIINDNNKISPVMTFYFGYQSLKKLKLVVNNANNISEYMIHDDKGDYNQQLKFRNDGEQIPVNEGVIDFINSNIKNDSLVYYEFIDYNDEGETIYVNPSQIKNMREISQIYRQLSPKQ